jgi:hypothetical protein
VSACRIPACRTVVACRRGVGFWTRSCTTSQRLSACFLRAYWTDTREMKDIDLFPSPRIWSVVYEAAAHLNSAWCEWASSAMDETKACDVPGLAPWSSSIPGPSADLPPPQRPCIQVHRYRKGLCHTASDPDYTSSSIGQGPGTPSRNSSGTAPASNWLPRDETSLISLLRQTPKYDRQSFGMSSVTLRGV